MKILTESAFRYDGTRTPTPPPPPPTHTHIYTCFCATFYCSYYWTQYKKATFSKLRVAYNNVYRKILGLCRRSSTSEMFVTNNILNSEALMRKSIFAFTSRLSISNNAII